MLLILPFVILFFFRCSMQIQRKKAKLKLYELILNKNIRYYTILTVYFI